MEDKKECITGCVEKPTFAPNKKPFWKRIRDWWVKRWEDYTNEINSKNCKCR